ncbi:MAG: lipopolysaccharide transport protein LptA [Rickettsiales bacterium]|jgi:lipopolysaccharide transport protein LptA
MNIRRLFFLSIILFTSSLFAEVGGVKSNIKSEIVKIVKDKNFIEFKNNVILVREDISFLAKKMLVFTKKGKEMSNDFQIELIEASGKVKIFNQTFIATGDYGTYDVKKNIFKIYGNVILNEGTKIAKGSEFIYDITTEKGSLLSQKDRPVIIINEDLNNLKQDINENFND